MLRHSPNANILISVQPVEPWTSMSVVIVRSAKFAMDAVGEAIINQNAQTPFPGISDGQVVKDVGVENIRTKYVTLFSFCVTSSMLIYT